MRKFVLSAVAGLALSAAAVLPAHAGVCLNKDGSVSQLGASTPSGLDSQTASCKAAGGSFYVISDTRGPLWGGSRAADAKAIFVKQGGCGGNIKACGRK